MTMQHTVDAVYENGVFRPLQSPDIPEGKKVRLTVSTESELDQEITKALEKIKTEETGEREKGRSRLSSIKEGELQPITLDSTNRAIGGSVQAPPSITVNTFTEVLKNSLQFTMVQIPSGTFMMGSPPNELGQKSCEAPQHRVRINEFFMGMMPVTQELYKAVMRRNPSRLRGHNRPVEMVSWNQAVTFCKRLSIQTGRNYRLPSEAEWEYACRAGTTTAYHVGPALLPEMANSKDSHAFRYLTRGIVHQTVPVGSFVPNAFGLFDMHGNVCEWCADHWNPNYDGAPSDGAIWHTEPFRPAHIVRGGSWHHHALDCRSASRARVPHASYRFDFVGFRVVCDEL